MFTLVLVVLATLAEPEPLPLIGDYTLGFGHACPTETGIYTARHVIEVPVPFSPFRPDAGYRHVSLSSPYGPTTVVWHETVRDVATISVEWGPVPRYKVATSIEEGDKVHWYEFDFKSRKKYLQPRKRKARVVRDVAGYLIFDKEPSAGASGTCLLNEDDEVVGIVVWGLKVQDSDDRIGCAASIMGVWKPKEPPTEE